jgi:hypothetical protein
LPKRYGELGIDAPATIMQAMALVMVRFQDGPLTGVTLPVDHTAEEYRHTVREAGYDGTSDAGSVRTTIHVYRRAGRTTFALDHTEDGGFD